MAKHSMNVVKYSPSGTNYWEKLKVNSKDHHSPHIIHGIFILDRKLKVSSTIK